MSYLTEFPDFDPATLPAIPADWSDSSWRNDVCPSFAAFHAIYIYVDYADAAKREFPESPRFSIHSGGDNPEFTVLLESDDWADVMAFYDRRKRLATAYKATVGYDPFEDSPEISADEVEATLAEMARIEAQGGEA